MSMQSPRPVDLRAQQRHQHGGEALQRAELVGDRDRRDHRLAVVAARHAEHAAHRFEREVVRGAVAVGARARRTR